MKSYMLLLVLLLVVLSSTVALAGGRGYTEGMSEVTITQDPATGSYTWHIDASNSGAPTRMYHQVKQIFVKKIQMSGYGWIVWLVAFTDGVNHSCWLEDTALHGFINSMDMGPNTTYPTETVWTRNYNGGNGMWINAHVEVKMAVGTGDGPSQVCAQVQAPSRSISAAMIWW